MPYPGGLRGTVQGSCPTYQFGNSPKAQGEHVIPLGIVRGLSNYRLFASNVPISARRKTKAKNEYPKALVT
jgi:hypothetical protein